MYKNKKLVSGFTFIKNGLSLGYPIKESIQSIAPLCEEVIINVGFDNPELINDDGTFDYLSTFFTDPKFKFIKSHWDPSLKKNGLILSVQTNIALKKCTNEFCLYIQGDEVIHQDDLEIIDNEIDTLIANPQIDGLVFNYLHFYGNVNVIKYTRNVYRREVRLIRNSPNIQSWLDAQGFRYNNGEKILSVLTKARIFHYGWARKQDIMIKKTNAFTKLYHGEDHQNTDDIQYARIWGLKMFKDSHPSVMQEWIEKNKNPIQIFSLPIRFEWKVFGLAISDFIEKLTGYRIGEFKNYKLY